MDDIQKNDEDIDGSNWLKNKNLSFPVDSAKAYEYDASNNTLVTYDPMTNEQKEKHLKMRKLMRN